MNPTAIRNLEGGGARRIGLRRRYNRLRAGGRRMRYVSLFSGIGGFERGIHKMFPSAVCAGYSEINPHALKVYQHHYPEHKNLGDVRKIKGRTLKRIDLLVGGPPCQNLSSFLNVGENRINGKGGLRGSKSKLFYHYIRLLKEIRPRHFIMENVASMKHSDRDAIQRCLEKAFKKKVYLAKLNSEHVSAQRRNRYYWTSFPVAQLKGGGKRISSILDKKSTVSEHKYEYIESTKARMGKIVPQTGRPRWKINSWSSTQQSKSIPVTRSWGTGTTQGRMLLDHRFRNRPLRRYGKSGSALIRHWTPEETERLQTFPTGWTKTIPRTYRYRTLGNAVTCKVVEHILKYLPKK